MKKVYMHTLDGTPAFFDGNQICFLPRARTQDVLRDSLDQIRAEQRKTIAWREKHGFWGGGARYGHVMFYV